MHGNDDGGVGDVSNYLAQFSVPTAYCYTHPAHMRAAHYSAAQDDQSTLLCILYIVSTRESCRHAVSVLYIYYTECAVATAFL